MIRRVAPLLAGLSKQQLAVVVAASFVSIVAMLALIWYFRKRNAA